MYRNTTFNFVRRSKQFCGVWLRAFCRESFTVLELSEAVPRNWLEFISSFRSKEISSYRFFVIAAADDDADNDDASETEIFVLCVIDCCPIPSSSILIAWAAQAEWAKKSKLLYCGL